MNNDVFANGTCQHCEEGPVVKIKAHGSAEQHWQCETCDSTYCWHEYEPIKSVKELVKKWCSGETEADDYAFQLLLNEFPEGERGNIHVWAFGGEIPDALLGKIAVKVALVGHELKHVGKEVPEGLSPHNELGSQRPYNGDDIDIMLTTVRDWEENDKQKYGMFLTAFINAEDRNRVDHVICRTGEAGKIGSSSDAMEAMVQVFKSIVGAMARAEDGGKDGGLPPTEGVPFRSEKAGFFNVHSGLDAPPDRTNPLDCKGNVYTGIDDGQPDILNTGIDHEVGHSIQVVREEQISGFNMGIELDTEGVEVIEEFDDDETTLIRRHATVTHRNLMRAQHTAYELMRDKKYEYVNPVRPVTVINNEVGMESYLGESELNTLYQIELVQDSLNLGVLTPEDQVNDLASFINTNCPEKINMDGGAVDIAIALLTEYLEVEKRIKAINILSDDTHDLERGLIDVIRITQ